MNIIKKVTRGVKKRINRYFYNRKIVSCMPTKSEKKRVFYLGVTEHSNLGDLAQCYCIRKWIKDNLPEYECFEFKATTVVDRTNNFVGKLKKIVGPEDIIVFQSGYTTTDLGGYHDLMHRMICSEFCNTNIIMMPQTILFKDEENKRRSSEEYSKALKMLFLARDDVSYITAKEMFPNLYVEKMPDIVTTLIGTFENNENRDGILFCIRDDGEKYYSDKEIDCIIQKLQSKYKVDRKDTTISVPYEEIQKDIASYVYGMIKGFSQYRLIVTDRYHGTIFSLISNTPVIVIKTNDHKVVTGLKWFEGVYDGYTYYEDDLNKLIGTIEKILNESHVRKLEPYFKENYYDKLKNKAFEYWNQ